MITANMTRAEIEKAIAEITAELKGHMCNLERSWLVEDRRELREKLKSPACTGEQRTVTALKLDDRGAGRPSS
jgi:hypothetical protein